MWRPVVTKSRRPQVRAETTVITGDMSKTLTCTRSSEFIAHRTSLLQENRYTLPCGSFWVSYVVFGLPRPPSK